MEIITLPNGIFGSNVYILSDHQECAVVDCGVRPEKVLSAVRENGFHVRYIILTHGHADHIYYAEAIKNATGAPLCIHEDEISLYSDSDKNGYVTFGFDGCGMPPVPDRLLKHSDKLPLGDTFLEIIHTPGHSPGSISIRCGNNLLSGDTLFAGSVGRTDLFGGSQKSLVDSVRNRLYPLDGSVTVYPGHGPATTIAYERENNPYV